MGVTVADTVPAGLTPTGAAGSGWTCSVSGQDVSCTRSDALAATASYPPITLTVNVAANAVLIPKYGRDGSAAATVIGEAVSLLLLLHGVGWVLWRSDGRLQTSDEVVPTPPSA